MPDVDPVSGWWSYPDEPDTIYLAGPSTDVDAARQTARALERMRANGASEDEISEARCRLAVP